MTQPIPIPSPKKTTSKPCPPGFGAGSHLHHPDPLQFRSLQEHLDYEAKKEAEEKHQRLEDQTKKALHEAEFEEGFTGLFEFEEEPAAAPARQQSSAAGPPKAGAEEEKKKKADETAKKPSGTN
jgi:hypothetical protein